MPRYFVPSELWTWQVQTGSEIVIAPDFPQWNWSSWNEASWGGSAHVKLCIRAQRQTGNGSQHHLNRYVTLMQHIICKNCGWNMIPVYWHTFTHADRDYWPMIADTRKMDGKIEKLHDKYKHVKSKGDVWQSVAWLISQLLFLYFVIKIPKQRKPSDKWVESKIIRYFIWTPPQHSLKHPAHLSLPHESIRLLTF